MREWHDPIQYLARKSLDGNFLLYYNLWQNEISRSRKMNLNENGRKVLSRFLADSPEFDARIRCSTEQHRKGAVKLRLLLPDGQEVKRASIRFSLEQHEFHFGCNAFLYHQFEGENKWKNEIYEEKFRELFNLAVIPFYWDAIEPERGCFRFERNSPKRYRRPSPDELLEFCETNRITPKGHPLIWHTFLPEWLPKEPGALLEEYERYISLIAERYGKRIPKFDVCNEGLSQDSLSENLKSYAYLPSDHILHAFRLAERYFPESTELIYNEGPWMSWDNYHGDYTPLYLLGCRLRSQGAALRGLGLQYHLFLWDMNLFLKWAEEMCDPGHLFAHMDLYARLGVPLNISEITIPSMAELGDGPAFQALLAEKLYRIWFSHPAVNAITWWNLVDQTAASDDENRYLGALLNYDMTEKPAYQILRHLIRDEWTSKGTLEFDSETKNKLYGFYGEYHLEIRTECGTYHGTAKLSACGDNRLSTISLK